MRSNDDRDHVHLLLFYADERSTRSPDTLPNKAGGVTGTFANHNFTLGAAYLNPASIRGEISFSLLYMSPIEEIFPEARDQYGIEAYWWISLSQNIWLTPGIHLVFDPSLNPYHDFIAIPHLKFRIAL